MSESVDIKTPISDERREQLWNAVLKLIEVQHRRKESALLLEAVICYMTREHKLYVAGNSTWKDFAESRNYNRTKIDRFVSAAKYIDRWARETYLPKSETAFLITEQMVDRFIEERHSKNQPIDLKSLREERLALEQFESYLGGESTMTVDAFAASMTIAKKAIAPTPSAAVQDNLFYVHERLSDAGYRYDSTDGTYRNPDGSKISDKEMGRYLDDESGLHIFDKVKKILVPAQQEIVSAIVHCRQFFVAYANTNQSPKNKQVIGEKIEELRTVANAIVREIENLTAQSYQ